MYKLLLLPILGLSKLFPTFYYLHITFKSQGKRDAIAPRKLWDRKGKNQAALADVVYSGTHLHVMVVWWFCLAYFAVWFFYCLLLSLYSKRILPVYAVKYTREDISFIGTWIFGLDGGLISDLTHCMMGTIVGFGLLILDCLLFEM